MAVLEEIEPREVFRYFEEITQIPHGSYHTDAISEYLVGFAEKYGLAYRRDEANNVVIHGEASPGYEERETVILQGHIDMVCVKEPGVAIDMDTKPIRLICDGETITADGTSLGGDDGIAVAMVLALLASKDIAHPPIEAVFTSDEEVGMLGAKALDMGRLTGRRMINIDSEDEGIITCGCAGGATVKGSLPVKRLQKNEGTPCEILLDGVKGGHSGIEIGTGGANAHVLMGRFLDAIEGDWQLISIDGGSKDNAIPNMAVAVVCGDKDAFVRAAKSCEDIFKKEYHKTDPEIRIEVKTVPAAGPAMTEETKCLVVDALRVLPGGVQRMSPDVEGLVQTSLNMGILCTSADAVELGFSVRSGVASEKEELIERVTRVIRLVGGQVKIEGVYPGWEYREESPLRDRMVEVFERMYGKKPVIDVIHAGLECGFFAERIPGLDAVSIGPDLRGVHTPEETMDVASVARVWQYLCEVLKEL